jgi:hypothetical protein
MSMLRQMRHIDLLARASERYPHADHLAIARMSRDGLIAWLEDRDA